MGKHRGFEDASGSRSRNMAAIKGKDTKPEMAVRRLLHRLGYRYRLHRKDITGHPDIAFIGRRKLIFVHGCFWHQHPGCRLAHAPKSRMDYWGPKLARNIARDAANLTALAQQGWDVLTIWECQVKDTAALQEGLTAFLSPLTDTGPPRPASHRPES